MNPISFFGSQLLGLAFPMALYSCLLYIIGNRRSRQDLIISAQRANILTFALITSAVATLIYAFVTNNYGILYVYSYSSSTLPLFYKITGLWAGLDGSILFWTWLVSLYAFIVFLQNKVKNSDWMPTINAVMMLVVLFFLTLMLFANNPFAPLIPAMMEGKGLNPLLQNYAMVVHPPCLYLGFTGFTVPFAFAMAALVSRRLDSSWIEDSRRWTMVAWGFLTIGLILGGAWAYVELGWGGFWGWDPVENAALMPWFTGTAYLHSVIVQKRRGMLHLWNVVLIILTFLLTIFGTYLTRSGVVQSVHAFSESNLGPFFLVFMALVLLGSMALILSRMAVLKSPNVLHSLFSKEAAFLLNNITLIIGCFAILWATMFPTMSELFTGQRITVGPEFFNIMMGPVGLILLLLMGIGPMLSWKKASTQNLIKNLLGPYSLGIIGAGVAFALGIRQWFVSVAIFLMIAVFGTLYLEFSRGIQALRLQNPVGYFSAFFKLLIQSNRRYGGYIVHLGVLFIFIGIAGAVFKMERDFTLIPGQFHDFAGYRFYYASPEVKEDEHATELKAHVDLFRGEKKLDQLIPAKNFYKTQEQPSTEVDLYQTILGDVYLIIGDLDPQSGRCDFRVTINPLISFIWWGGIIIVLGIIILLLPRYYKAQIIPIFLLTCFLSGSGYAGEPFVHTHDPSIDAFAGSDLKPELLSRVKDISQKLICQCGGCVRMDLKACTCGFAKQERDRILSLIQGGKSDPEVVQNFVDKYGVAVLSLPPNKGLLKIGYWIPPLLLLFGGVVGFFLIRTWLKPANVETKNPISLEDPAAKRLAQELKELK